MIGKFKAAVLLAAAFVLFDALPAACGELQQKLIDESTIEQAVKRGVLRVGMSTFVPWAMTDKAGHLIGFEIDVNDVSCSCFQVLRCEGFRQEFTGTLQSKINL